MSSFEERKKQLETARNNWKEDNIAFQTTKSLERVARGRPYNAPIEAIKLGIKLRKAARKHEDAPWIIAFCLAISCDLMDLIPIAGWVITLFFRPVLFIFLFGRGTLKLRLIVWLILLLDFLPVINIIPMSTACVYYAYRKSKKDYFLSKQFDRVLSVLEGPA